MNEVLLFALWRVNNLATTSVQRLMRGPFPVVTALLIGANLEAYVAVRAALVAGGDPCGPWGLVPERLLRTGELTPFFTATLLHGSLVHLAGNLAVLVLLGTVVERAMGHLRFLTLFI